MNTISFTFVINNCGETTYSNEVFEKHPCELFLSVDKLISTTNSNEELSKDIPRPLNSFMLFRRNFSAGIVEENKDRTFVSKVSGKASKAWKEASPQVKGFFSALAEKAKLEHKIRYPAYKYNPKKKMIRKRSNKHSKKPNKSRQQKKSSVIDSTQQKSQIHPNCEQSESFSFDQSSNFDDFTRNSVNLIYTFDLFPSIAQQEEQFIF
ncbi:6972_t:CDS:1 [Ambispora gerdemannii]|uniref:6972_t:CDS:1 n=1 Tax=Ambispora gerdemannii TaxID=144530 RepID=A0A9N8UXG3_9GLOM|nr:6972_t:CDS:1 [Ambispora gerdemannii]